MTRQLNRFGHTIFYVQDVKKTVEFYEKAFGILRQFIDETGQYAQMDTGATVLGFASLSLAKENLKQEFLPLNTKQLFGCEISFLTRNIDKSLTLALKAGAELIAPATAKPWGQTIAYVRDFNGILIEIGTEMDCPVVDANTSSCGCC